VMVLNNLSGSLHLTMLSFFFSVSRFKKADVFAYEYEGYATSLLEGRTPSEVSHCRCHLVELLDIHFYAPRLFEGILIPMYLQNYVL